MGIIAGFIGAIGLIQTSDAAKQQARETGKQTEALKEQQVQQKKLADIKSARERRRIARESRTARAQINVATGGDASSKAAGVSGSVITQTAGAAGFAGQQEQIGQSIFEQGLIATEASAGIASARARGQVGSALTTASISGYNIFKD